MAGLKKFLGYIGVRYKKKKTDLLQPTDILELTE